jgi:hypothetical protein
VTALPTVAGAVLAILIGLALGVVVVRRRKLLAPAAKPFGSLLRTLRPLVLPLFAVAIVGSTQLSLWVAIAVTTTLTVIALRFVVMPEARQLAAVETWDRKLIRAAGKHGAWRLASLTAVVVAAILSVALSTRYFESIGGWTAFLLVLALLLWLVAFLLRFVSYASSWLRAGVALFIVLTGLYFGAAIGILPEGAWLAEHVPWLESVLPLAAVALLGIEAVFDIVAARRNGHAQGGARSASVLDRALAIRRAALGPGSVQITQGLGLGMSLLAAIVLAISTLAGLGETAQPGETLSVESAAEAAEEPSPAAPGRFADDLALAKAYAPVLAFTSDERWSPISVDSYAREAVLSGPLKEPLADPSSVQEKLDRACPRLATSPCYRLSIRCKDGHEPCGMAVPHPDRNSERLYPEGDVYMRVVRKSAEEAEERRRETEHLRRSDRWPPRVFVDEGPYRESLTALLQYWYFYRYDEWETRVFAGQLVQRHEGDWEAVTIGLSDRRPLFTAYSAHCGGTWKPWKAIEVSDKFPEPTHPLVAVAEGSHANYPKADQKRTPDPAHCQGIPAGTTALLSYASNIRDKTEYGWQWYPSDGGWHMVDADTLPMSFPGYWGADESTTLVGFFKSSTLGEGHGPKTPSQQPLWESPITKIFCGNYSGPSGNYHCKEG